MRLVVVAAVLVMAACGAEVDAGVEARPRFVSEFRGHTTGCRDVDRLPTDDRLELLLVVMRGEEAAALVGVAPPDTATWTTTEARSIVETDEELDAWATLHDGDAAEAIVASLFKRDDGGLTGAFDIDRRGGLFCVASLDLVD